MVEFPPDIRSSALLLYDDEARIEEVFRVFLSTDGIRKVYAVSRADLYSNFRFIFEPWAFKLCLPNAVYYEDSDPFHAIFVGSAATVNDASCKALGTTHIVSLLSRHIIPPPKVNHLLCKIEDDIGADLFPVLRKALPFIANALSGPSATRILIHCERGASRLVSVAIAFLMYKMQTSNADLVLDLVQKQHRCARPNNGFMAYLWGLRISNGALVDGYSRTPYPLTSCDDAVALATAAADVPGT